MGGRGSHWRLRSEIHVAPRSFRDRLSTTLSLTTLYFLSMLLLSSLAYLEAHKSIDHQSKSKLSGEGSP